MFIKRELRLESTYASTLETLKKQLLASPPTGTVCNEEFRLYKTVAPRHRRGYIVFAFSGKVTDCSTQTLVQYQVRPFGPTVLFAALLILLPLIGILRVLPEVSGSFVLVYIAANVIFYLLVFEQMKMCISRFEESLRGQGGGSAVP
jgi:hypothetical protein